MCLFFIESMGRLSFALRFGVLRSMREDRKRWNSSRQDPLPRMPCTTSVLLRFSYDSAKPWGSRLWGSLWFWSFYTLAKSLFKECPSILFSAFPSKNANYLRPNIILTLPGDCSSLILNIVFLLCH